MKIELLQLVAKIGAKSKFLKAIGTKLAIHILPEEVETKVANSRFVFRPKIDGLWYLNYSDAEPGIEKVLKENLSEGDVFVDAGAYIGYYSILARNIVGEKGKVIAFEPNPESHRMLKKNFELNKYENCIPENIALSDEEGFLKLFIGKCTDDSSSFFLTKEVNGEKYVMVKTITFDSYCEHGIAPKIIKIDAEGAEYKILKGVRKIIDTYHPKLIIVVHPRHLEKQGISLHTLFDSLKERYNIQLVEEEGSKAISLEGFISLCKTGRRNCKYGTIVNQVIFCNAE